MIAFYPVDTETGQMIETADYFGVRKQPRGYNKSRLGQVANIAPRSYSLIVNKTGYRPVYFDGLEVLPHQLVLVTVQMHRGQDTVFSTEAWKCCVTAEYDDFYDLLAPNRLMGTVTDNSSQQPVADASVWCPDLDVSCHSDSLGEFQIDLDTLRKVTLHVWHSDYDSIRLSVSKTDLHSDKPVAIDFEKPRVGNDAIVSLFSDSTVLLTTTVESWNSWIGGQVRESGLGVFTWAVREGDVFGPTDKWPYYSSFPFRLIRTFDNRTAWVQFTKSLGRRPDWTEAISNFLTVSDTAVSVSPESDDAGIILTLQLQPDYTPHNAPSQKPRNPIQIYRFAKDTVPPDPCSEIRAKIEHMHAKLVLRLMESDPSAFAIALGADYRASLGNLKLTLANTNRFLGYRRAQSDARRIGELFSMQDAEVYINGPCDTNVSDSYVALLKRIGRDPEEGDVYVRFPHRSSNYGTRFGALYRKTLGFWRLIA